MTVATSADRGRIVAATDDADVRRVFAPIANTPIVYCHSAAASPYEMVSVAPLPALRGIFERLGRWGFNTVAPTTIPMFGASLTPIENALTYHRANLLGTSDPPIIIGTSAGAPAAIRYAMDDGAETPAAIVLFIPAIDLVDLYEDPGSGLQALIGTAWSVGSQGQAFTTVGKHDWTAPSDAVGDEVNIDLQGGGDGGTGGGSGRRLTGVMSITPGEDLDVWVGGDRSGQTGGSSITNGTGGNGGNNGTFGAGPGGGGGGATLITTNNGAKSNALCVAGAGAGPGGNGAGGGNAQNVLDDMSLVTPNGAGGGSNGAVGQGGGGGGGNGWRGGAGGGSNAGGTGGTSGYLPSRFGSAPSIANITNLNRVDVSWLKALPSTADLIARAAECTVPVYLVAASDDPVSVNFATFVAGASDVTVDNVGALGHTDAAIAAADEDAIMQFVLDNA